MKRTMMALAIGGIVLGTGQILAIAFDGKDQMTHVWTWRQDGHSAPMTFTLKRKK
ncbi:MAG: hypothetical protein H0U18_01045 [Pyrinomonadaceae bacterium]|nr:hypothetical protein [Pyrinomonadaceae bacterium]